MRELIDAIRRYAPRTDWTLVGATESEVAAVETALGHALPSSYRGFLLTGGRYLGLFRPFDEHYDFSIDTVRAAALESTGSPRYVFIARDRAGLDMDLYLDCEPPSDDPPVVAILRGGGRIDPRDDSFRRFMLTEVFVSMRLPLLVWQARFVASGDPSLLRELAVLAGELRMPAVPDTGGWHPCYDRGDLAVEARQPPGLGFVLTAAAAEESWLERLQRILEQRLGLTCIT